MKNLTKNTKGNIFGISLMILATLFLSILLHYELIEKYIGFALIPLMAAYQLGQYSERKFKK